MHFSTDFVEEEQQGQPTFRLRGRQKEWIDKVEIDLATYSRLLFLAPGGVGKSTCFAELARRFWTRGMRTLVLANRDGLVRQTAGRIEKETGLEVAIEMADSYASPHAPIVVATPQTLSKINRLTGFPDDAFGLVVPDEAHFSLSPIFQRVLAYHHYGAASLQEGWVAPKDGTYIPKASIVGFTATPNIGPKRSLMEFYQRVTVNYTYLEAVEEGWLCGATQKSIPVRIDLRKKKIVAGDFRVSDLSESLIPVMEELADQLLVEASQRKAMAFLPSVDTAKMLTDALVKRGMDAVYVSGSCVDGDEKTDHFRAAGKGSVLCNAQIYNFGIDFPDVDCVAWFRATLSKAFYIQGIYRASRVLPGVVDGRETAEERLLAIAASAKPNFLILDPLFVHDRIDLCDAYDLYADKPEIKERMKITGELTPENAKEAERDFLKALEKEAKKHAKKAARVFDPIKLSVSIGEADLATYRPENAEEAAPLTEIQKEYLTAAKFDWKLLTCRGQADKVMRRLELRKSLGLATAEQLTLLARLGLPEDFLATLKKGAAGAIIGRKLAGRRY